MAAQLSLSLFSCIPVGVDGILPPYITNTTGKVHYSDASNFLTSFMRIFTPLRPIISETNQFLRFLRLIQLALNETKSSNSECRQWVSIPRPTRMLYAARGHILELHVYYKNCTVTRQVAYTRGQRFRPRRRCWLFTHTHTHTKKRAHMIQGDRSDFITAYADTEKMDRPTPKRSGTCNYAISSLWIWSVKYQMTHARTRQTQAYCSIRPSNYILSSSSLPLPNFYLLFLTL